MITEEEEEIGWAVHVPQGEETWLTTKPIAISLHAAQRVAERFGLEGEEGVQFILQHLFSAGTGRRTRRGAVKWQSGEVTIITREHTECLVVLTVCKTPPPRRRVKGEK